MKKSFFLVVLVVLVGFFMLATCPKDNDHKEAICLSINKAVDEKFGDSSLSISGLINYGSKLAIKNAARLFIDSNVEVQNYGLLSIGRYTFNGRNKVISVGMFNHVFTISKNDILEEVQKYGF